MHVRRSLGGVVLVFMNATGIQYFAGNHILTKTYYGSPLEVARAFQSPAPPFHYTCPALINCKSMSKCDEKHLRCNLPCQVLSIVGLDTFIYHEVLLALLHQPLAVSIYLKIYRIT